MSIFTKIAAVAATTLALAMPASALTFSFDPGTGDGSGTQTFDSGSDFTLFITGNDNGDDDVLSLFSAVAASDMTISGWWSSNNWQDAAFYDPLGYIVDGVETLLTDTSGPDHQSGTFSFGVLTGQTFGFFIDSTDGCCGRGFGAVSSVGPIAAVPLPASLPLALAGLGGLAALRRRRKAA